MKIRKMILGWTSAIVCALAVTTACNESLYIEEEIHRPPQITEFAPKTGMAGTKVYIQGTDFKEVKDITIGGRKVNVTRVNSRLVMAEVTAKAVTGAIEVITPYGVARSEEEFVVSYRRPVVTESPEKADLFSTIELKGTDLDLVERVYFGTAEATILEQKENSLSVSVPYYSTDEAVKIRCTYMYGLNSEDAYAPVPFTAIKIAPGYGIKCAAEAGVGGSFVMTGERMNIIEKVTVNGYKAMIESQTDDKIICAVPAEITEACEDNKVVISYWGGVRERVISTDFKIKVFPYYIWKNVTLFGPNHSDPRKFFSGITGKHYTACEFKNDVEVQKLVHLCVQGQGGGQTIIAPVSVNNFKCDNVDVGKVGNYLRFVRLKEDNPVHKQYIDMINSGTLKNVSVAQIEKDGITYSSNAQTIRYKASDANYNATDAQGIRIGDITMVLVYEWGITSASGTVTEIGFLKLVDVALPAGAADADAGGAMTVDFYFQKNNDIIE